MAVARQMPQLKRIATAIVEALQPLIADLYKTTFHQAATHLVLQLRLQGLDPEDLDTVDGLAALFAVARALPYPILDTPSYIVVFSRLPLPWRVVVHQAAKQFNAAVTLKR
jgi:hypothetical protein